MKKLFIILLSLFLITGCSFNDENDSEKVSIYTTTYPLKYLAEYLFNDYSEIYSIYPTGIDFKNYELSDKKLTEYAKSNIFLFNSQDQDRNYAKIMINENKNLLLIDSSLGMNYNYAIQELWLNPYNYLMMAKNTKNSLIDYVDNPYQISNKDNTGIKDKYESLELELSKLDATYKDIISNGTYKTIITDNKLFKFLERYNIEVIYLEENIISVTIKENQSLSDIAKEYNVSVSDILTYNNKQSETVNVGETIKVPISTIDSADLNLAKKLISENEIKYIYSTNSETNSTINSLITKYNLELLTINDMYSIDGGITNTNESYFTIMNDNLELYKKELYK